MESKSPLFRALFKEREAKGISKLDRIVRSFSATEKALFLICVLVFAGAVLSLIGKVSDAFSVTVPERGGTLVEGVVGTPRFINPLLAVSDADRDLSALVYSGLLRENPDGSIVPDLAESYTESSDGLTYTVVIKPNARWSDGEPVTADDVIFTVGMAQDPNLKSPRRASWEGVTVDKTDDRTVVFKLKQPYTPFIDSLTQGILPAHLWKSLTSDQIPFSSLNLAAIGSGPYEIASVIKSSDGIPTEVDLRSNPDYALGEPYLSTIDMKFYDGESALVAALKSGAVESASNLSPQSAAALSGSTRLLTAPMTRVFAVFFNQNQNELLAHKDVREALSLAIDRDQLIKDILLGYGTVADGPLPPSVAEATHANAMIIEDTATSTASSTAAEASSTMAHAQSILVKAGWKLDASTGLLVKTSGKGKSVSTTTLAVTLSTADVPELVAAAKEIESDWKAIGVDASVRVFEPSDLNQSVIRPRQYDALLFGLVTGKGADLYPFWDSSQRQDPGLNVALYTNHTADRLLSDMRQATSSAQIATDYEKLKEQMDSDIPAAFLWSPDFVYAVPKTLEGVSLGEITTASDRFDGIGSWYATTDRVWRAFAPAKGI